MSLRDVIRVPAMLCALMLAIGLATSLAAGVDGRALLFDYVVKGTLVTMVALLIWLFAEVAKLARTRADRPLAIVAKRLPPLLPMLALPCLVFPLFLAGYTTAKTSISFLVGFGWDRFWADADLFLFGRDPWVITHGLDGPLISHAWAWGYTYIWGAALLLTMALVAIYGSRRFIATFYTAMFASWLIGGWMVAIGFSAAGPVFAHLFDPGLGPRFEPLRSSLGTMLGSGHPLLMTQAYLANATDHLVAVRGGGISAMPSMHVAACTIYVIAARGTRWLFPALALWLMIFVGSVHFGYHYAVDGIVAAVIAVLSWRGAAAYFRSSGISPEGQRIAPAF